MHKYAIGFFAYFYLTVAHGCQSLHGHGAPNTDPAVLSVDGHSASHII
jgi:hypothetical protein